jgi:hypothetical protein
VAHEAANQYVVAKACLMLLTPVPNSWEVDIDQDAERYTLVCFIGQGRLSSTSSGDSSQCQKLRFMTPTGSPSPSPSPEPQWQMPSFIDYLNDYMHRRRM